MKSINFNLVQLEYLFGSTLESKTGRVRTVSLSGKYKLIYFSAHWCSPCRDFTQILSLFYEQVNSGRHQVDIIFVSLDTDQGFFQHYFNSMPWLALPFKERQRAKELTAQFSSKGIPHLVLIDNQGRMKRRSCRDDVTTKGPACLADWDRVLN
jgi:nucleoredoxin